MSDFEKIKTKIRQAEIKDISEILRIEKEAWGEEGAATEEMFEFDKIIEILYSQIS